MQKSSVVCKECRFWVQYVEDDPKLGTKMSDFGLCLQSRSVNWGLRMHQDTRCENGERKE